MEVTAFLVKIEMSLAAVASAETDSIRFAGLSGTYVPG